MTTSPSLSRRGFLGRSAALGAAALAGSLPTRMAAAAMVQTGSTWQIGCYTRPWAKFDDLTAMDAIAEAGFKYLGLMTIKRYNPKLRFSIDASDSMERAVRLGEEAKKRGLEMVSVFPGGIRGPAGVATIANVRRAIDLSAATGAKSMLMTGPGTPKQYDAHYAAFAACGDYAAEKNIGLALKPHSPLDDTGAELRKAVETVNNKNFRVWYDPGNIFHVSDGKNNPVDEVTALDGLLTGCVIKDFRTPKNVDVTPGTGMVDFKVLLAKMQKGGFRGGPLLVETLSPGDLPHLLAEAKKARTFLEELVRG